MNQDSENFEQLRKLLALKKHEQPPPGYFNELPGKIWTRIEKEKAAPSLWSDFLTKFVLRPTVAYGFAFIVCATLIIAIGTSLNNGTTTKGASGTPIVQQQLPKGFQPGSALVQELDGRQPTNVSSTNPVTPAAPELRVQPAAFNQ